MKQHLWTGLIAIAILLTSTLSACSAKATPAEIVFEVPQGAVNLKRLPPGLAMPPALPAAIQDAQLLEAWIYLYDQLDPVQLWDNSTLTGQGLAQFVLERAIPIVWDRENQCGGASCSVHYCHKDTCTYEAGSPSPAPIYVSLANRGDLHKLVATLAHEIYHRQEPFGPVRSTRFEEYWAYKVGVSISGTAWPKFAGYDPLVPAQLVQWFKDNHINGYYGLQYYPPVLSGVAQDLRQGAGLMETLTNP